MTKELKCEFQKEIDNEKVCKAFEVNRYGDIICQEEDCQLCKLKVENAKLKSCLQEVKETANTMYEDYSKRWDDNISEGLEQIIDLITKAEEE